MGVKVRFIHPGAVVPGEHPDCLQNGDQEVVVTYEGFVDAGDDNPVRLTLILDPSANVNFCGHGNEMTWEETFNTSYQKYEKGVCIAVNRSPGIATPCGLQFKAETRKGVRSSDSTFLCFE